jgi:hypothetical protein
MKFLTRIKLAKVDKRITRLLRESRFYIENKNQNKDQVSLNNTDFNELWVKEVEKFIDLVLGEKTYMKLIELRNLSRQDLIDFYILMTLATMPNPIFKTAHARLSHTLVGSAIYQEIDKHLNPFIKSLGQYNIPGEQDKYGHKFASDVMSYAIDLKFAHELSYGNITFEEAL